jgi:hypothetical protein
MTLVVEVDSPLPFSAGVVVNHHQIIVAKRRSVARRRILRVVSSNQDFALYVKRERKPARACLTGLAIAFADPISKKKTPRIPTLIFRLLTRAGRRE